MVSKMPAAYSPVGMRHGYLNIVNAFVGVARNNETALNGDYIEHFLLGSGKSALLLILLAMRECCMSKSEVIIPAYTCYSVAAAVKAAGLEIRLVDIDIFDLNYLPEKLEQALGIKTLAVVFPSFFSLPIQKHLLSQVSNEKKIRPYIIVDSAQSYFCDEKKYKADAYIFSFGRGKPLNAEGGGLLGVLDSKLKTVVREKYRALPDEGVLPSIKLFIKSVLNDLFLHPHLYWIPSQIKSLKLGVTEFPQEILMKKMSPYQKNLWLQMDNRIPEIQKIRQDHASVYRSHCMGERQLNIPEEFSPARYPVYLDRKRIDEEKDQNLKRYGVTRMYPNAISKLYEIRNCCVNLYQDFANSEWVAGHLYTLPVHEFMSAHARDDVIRLVKPYLT